MDEASKVPKEPIPGSETKFKVETRYVGEGINLKEIQEKFAMDFVFLNQGGSPLVIRLSKKEPGEYAVLTKFGTVGFWSPISGEVDDVVAAAKAKSDFLSLITPYIQNKKESYDFTDTLEVTFSADLPEKNPLDVTFDTIRLREPFLKKEVPNVEFIKMISYVPAQSGALDRYESEVEDLLRDLRPILENLHASGRPRVSQKKLLQQIAGILLVQDDVVGTIALLDKPDETWDIKGLELLYDKLSNEYDLNPRFDTLSKKMGFLTETHNTLSSVTSTIKSYKVEILIVVLIALEIIFNYAPNIFKLFRH